MRLAVRRGHTREVSAYTPGPVQERIRPPGAGEEGLLLVEVDLARLAAQLIRVPGVVGVALGGSRARGEARPDSDVDLGLYYRSPLDVSALHDLARLVAGDEAEVTEPGDWGPWVDGGAWLRIAETSVDWIYRDLDRVEASWSAAKAGRLEFHFQVGHPFGVANTSYAGELALARVLADPTGQLVALHRAARDYPPALADAFDRRLAEADFLLDHLAKPSARADTSYVAGVLFRVVELCAYALYGRARRWVINEKGAVDGAARLPTAPPGFAEHAHGVLAQLGRTPDSLMAARAAARHLLASVRGAD